MALLAFRVEFACKTAQKLWIGLTALVPIAFHFTCSSEWGTEVRSGVRGILDDAIGCDVAKEELARVAKTLKRTGTEGCSGAWDGA